MLIPKIREQTEGIFVTGRFQVCFGNIDIPANEESTVFTFPKAFSFPPTVVVTNAIVNAGDVFWSIAGTTAENVSVYAHSVSKGNTVTLRARYVAIGIKD